MSKKRLLIAITSSLIMFSTASCDFINYIPPEEKQVVDEKLENAKKEKINLLQGQFNLDNYYEEQAIQLSRIIREATLEINECASVDDVNKAHSSAVEKLNAIKTKQVIDKEYKNAKKEEIATYFKLEDYREKEAKIIQALHEEYLVKIENAATTQEVDNLAIEFKVKVYENKTDAELYQEELILLKEERFNQLSELLNIAEYREQEANKINQIINEFKAKSDSINKKEEVESLFLSYKEKLTTIKTDRELIIEECYQKLIAFYCDHIKNDETLLKQKLADVELIKQKMDIESSKKTILEMYYSEIVSYLKDKVEGGDASLFNELASSVADSLITYKYDASLDDETRSALMKQIEELSNTIKKSTNLNELTKNYENAINKLDNLSYGYTVDKFIQRITEKHGNILELPEHGLLDAYSDIELGQIIDFFVFYQIDDSTFEMPNIVVNLHYEHGNSSNINQKIYNYSELIQNSVSYEYTLVGDVLSIKFTAHGFQTFGDGTHYNLDRRTPLSFKSDSTKRTKRDENYVDFGFTKNTKKVDGIWNSNQLLYALEHHYNVSVVKGSSAENCLNKAEEILRSCVTDDMSIEEKFFNIFTYFGKHTYNAWFDQGFIDRCNAETKFNQLYRIAEGTLFYGFGVCQGMNKAVCLVCGVEGLECIIRKGSLTSTDADNHLDLLIQGSDGLYYHSNPHDTVGLDWDTINYQSIFESTADSSAVKSTSARYPNLPESTNSDIMHKNLYYGDKNIIASTLDEFKDIHSYIIERGEWIYVPVFVDGSIEKSCIDYCNGAAHTITWNSIWNSLNSPCRHQILVKYS